MVHYNRGKAGTGETIPICKQKTRYLSDLARWSYTRDRSRVTCKNCIRALEKPVVVRPLKRVHIAWKVNELRYIKEHYQQPIKELAHTLNRTFGSVRACVDRIKSQQRGSINE
jgi:hypothetical protein